jgi:hypothetical protein
MRRDHCSIVLASVVVTPGMNKIVRRDVKHVAQW